MRFRLSAIAIFCTTAIATSVSNADGSVPAFATRQDLVWTFPTAGVHGAALPAQFTQDRMLDAIALRDDQAFLLYGPDQYDTVVQLGTGILGVAVVRGGGINGLDAIALAGSSGVQVRWSDDTQHLASSTVSTGAIAAIAAANIDNLFGQDLIALGDDATSFRIFLANPTGPGSFQEGAGFTVAAPVDSFIVLDIDNDLAPEVALLTGGSLEIRRLDGSLHSAFPGTSSGGSLTRFQQHTTFAIAWVRVAADGLSDELIVVRASGADAALDLGPIGVVHVTAGDLNADKRDDLVVSHRASRQVILLENQSATSPGATFGLGAGQAMTVDIDTAPDNVAPENNAWPVVGDLDNDGDLDVLCTCQATETVAVLHNLTIDADTLKPQVQSLLYLEAEDLAAFTSDSSYVVGPPGNDPISGDAFLVMRVLPPTASIEASNVIDVMVWRKADHLASAAPVTVEHAWYPIPAGWSDSHPAEILVPMDEPTYPFLAVYDIEVRVLQTVDQLPRRPKPVYAAALATDPATMGLFASTHPTQYYSVPLYVPSPLGGYQETVETSGLIPQPPPPLHLPLFELPILEMPVTKNATPGSGGAPGTGT